MYSARKEIESQKSTLNAVSDLFCYKSWIVFLLKKKKNLESYAFKFHDFTDEG